MSRGCSAQQKWICNIILALVFLAGVLWYNDVDHTAVHGLVWNLLTAGNSNKLGHPAPAAPAAEAKCPIAFELPAGTDYNYSFPMGGGGLNNCLIRIYDTLSKRRRTHATLLPSLLTVPWSMRSREPGFRWASMTEFYNPDVYCEGVTSLGFVMPNCSHVPATMLKPELTRGDPAYLKMVEGKAGAKPSITTQLGDLPGPTVGAALFFSRSFQLNSLYLGIVLKMQNTVEFHTGQARGYIAVHMRIEPDLPRSLLVTAEDIIDLVNRSSLLENSTSLDPTSIWVSSGMALSTVPVWKNFTGDRTSIFHKNSFNGLFSIDLSENTVESDKDGNDGKKRIPYIARAAIDMEMAVRASVFIGHGYSTLARNVMLIREMRNAGPNYFYTSQQNGKAPCLRRVRLHLNRSNICTKLNEPLNITISDVCGD